VRIEAQPRARSIVRAQPSGRDQDRIVSFEAFVVENDSPPPGERQSRNVRTKVFLRFPQQ
jgi:hypothetical protein